MGQDELARLGAMEVWALSHRLRVGLRASGALALAAALAACAGQRPAWTPPKMALDNRASGPVPSGFARLKVDLDQVRWGSGLAQGLPGPQRGLLGLGFSETDAIQKLVLRASYLTGDAATPELTATEVVLTYSGSVPSPISLLVPAGKHRVYELLGQRVVQEGASTTTYNVAQAYSLGQAPNGEVLSLTFNPDHHAAGRTLRNLLDDASAGNTEAQSLLANEDICATLVAFVNAETGYSSATNQYARVNPMAFRSKSLTTHLREGGVAALNAAPSSLPDTFETEGWARLRLKAELKDAENQAVPQGGDDVQVDLYDLYSGGTKKLDPSGQAMWAKVPPGVHSLRFRSPNGERWEAIDFSEGEDDNRVLDAFTQHPFGPQRVLVNSATSVDLVGLVPNHASGVPGFLYQDSPSASDQMGMTHWMGLLEGRQASLAQGGGNYLAFFGGVGVAQGANSGARVYGARTTTGTTLVGTFGNFRSPSSQSADVGLSPGVHEAKAYTDANVDLDLVVFRSGNTLRSLVRGYSAPSVLANDAVRFDVDGRGGSARVVWENTAGRLWTRRVSFNSAGTMTLSTALELGGAAGLQQRPSYCVVSSEVTQGAVAFEHRDSEGASPRIRLMELSPTEDGWATSGSTFVAGAHPHLTGREANFSVRFGLHHETAGGTSGRRLRYGEVESDSESSSGFRWALDPLTVAEPGLDGCQADAFRVNNIAGTLHLWRHASGEIRSRLQVDGKRAQPSL